MGDAGLNGLAAALRAGRGLAAKRDIGLAARHLSASPAVPIGDDCAAIPDGDGWLLFAIEGFIEVFVAHDPWFAGWCGVMVNLSDVAAMGGRGVAVVDAIWSAGSDDAAAMLAGLHAASEAFGVPIVGGHTNLNAAKPQLSVAVLGRGTKLLTSFDMRPGDRIVAAIDLRGQYRDPFPNWDAATAAPPARLRGDMALLPDIAEAGLSVAAKDISQAGLVGTLAMFCESSGTGAVVDPHAVPRPDGVNLERWLQSFPSFGYLLAVASGNVGAILARFADRGIAAADIGLATAERHVRIGNAGGGETVWDFDTDALMGWKVTA